MASNPSNRPVATGKLDLDESRTLVIPALGKFDVRFNIEKLIYHPVPSTYPKIENPSVWRVVLKFGKKPKRLGAGLDIYSDTVFGRGAFEPDSPDIDLSNLEAVERGVSRIHALLRPGPTSLFLIDLKSTNGTFVNGTQLKQGVIHRINHNDEIAFSGLAFVVEIVSPPTVAAEVPSPKATPAEIAPELRYSKPRTGTETIFGVKLELPTRPVDQDPKK